MIIQTPTLVIRDFLGFRSAPAPAVSSITLAWRDVQQPKSVQNIIHYIVEHAFVRGAAGLEPGQVFLRAVENASSFETHPIDVLLHEAISCQKQASRWSAERVRAEFPEFDPAARSPRQRRCHP
jgi:hypothetical protein